MYCINDLCVFYSKKIKYQQYLFLQPSLWSGGSKRHSNYTTYFLNDIHVISKDVVIRNTTNTLNVIDLKLKNYGNLLNISTIIDSAFGKGNKYWGIGF